MDKTFETQEEEEEKKQEFRWKKKKIRWIRSGLTINVKKWPSETVAG